MPASLSESIPVVILGGSDLQPSELPEDVNSKHALCAYKGREIQLAGRPLIEIIIERLRCFDELGPFWIAGPERIYGDLAAADGVIDTDRSVGQNARAAVEHFMGRRRTGPLAFTTCDILPDPEELRLCLDDFTGRGDLDIWFPLIRTPEQPEALGEFSWKPRYRVRPEPGAEPVSFLPGHFLIVNPRSLRLRFTYSLLDALYRTRNRPIDTRLGVAVRTVLLRLLAQDFLHLAAFRLPTLTWTILTSGIGAARGLKQGGLVLSELERAVARVFVRARHRRRYPGRGARLPLIDGLSIAEDVDTEEEIRELEAQWKAQQKKGHP